MSLLIIPENILMYICGLGIFQGILLACMIYFHPRSNKSANRFLALFIGSATAVMSAPLLHQFIPWQHCFLIEACTFLPGPLMYLYVRSLKEKISKQSIFIHLIPFLLYSLFACWWFGQMAKEYPGSKTYPTQSLGSALSFTVLGIRYIQMMTYYVLSLKVLKKYQGMINKLFSTVEVKWINWLIHGFLVLILSMLLIFGMMVEFPELFYQLFLLNIALATPYIYVSTFKGITQPAIWQLETERIMCKNSDRQNTETQQPSDDRHIDLIGRIKELMEKDKLFQETELSLQQLATRLEVPAYQVSVAINDGMNMGFYELVNNYRVEEAKRILLDPASFNYTILSVGFEAGFNSKTTFNTVFKKITGFTPSDFRSQQKLAVLRA